MTDREALEALFKFMANRTFVSGTPEVVRDMVKRYEQPPMTMHNRVAMQMTKAEYDSVSLLLTRIMYHLKPPEVVEDSVTTEIDGDPIYIRNPQTGELDQVGFSKNEPV